MKKIIRPMSQIITRVPHRPPFLFTPIKPPRFCVNMHNMFPNKAFHEGYLAAKELGFTAIESCFPPLDYHPLQLASIVSTLGMRHVMMDTYAGDVGKGEYGFAALPDKKDEFKQSLTRTIQYAEALGIKRINILAGVVEKQTNQNDMTFVENLIYAEEVLRKVDIVGLIEPVDRYSLPNYYLDNYDLALDLLERMNSPNLKLLLDIFHMQLIQGNISHTLPYIMPYVGHVQVAQVPNRNEPNSKRGELQYEYILEGIIGSGYSGWIGLEYTPTKSGEAGIAWIHDYGYCL